MEWRWWWSRPKQSPRRRCVHFSPGSVRAITQRLGGCGSGTPGMPNRSRRHSVPINNSKIICTESLHLPGPVCYSVGLGEVGAEKWSPYRRTGSVGNASTASMGFLQQQQKKTERKPLMLGKNCTHKMIAINLDEIYCPAMDRAGRWRGVSGWFSVSCYPTKQSQQPRPVCLCGYSSNYSPQGGGVWDKQLTIILSVSFVLSPPPLSVPRPLKCCVPYDFWNAAGIPNNHISFVRMRFVADRAEAFKNDSPCTLYPNPL